MKYEREKTVKKAQMMELILKKSYNKKHHTLSYYKIYPCVTFSAR